MTSKPRKPTEEERAERAAGLSGYISRIVDEAPPLSNGQRARLAALLGAAIRAGRTP